METVLAHWLVFPKHTRFFVKVNVIERFRSQAFKFLQWKTGMTAKKLELLKTQLLSVKNVVKMLYKPPYHKNKQSLSKTADYWKVEDHCLWTERWENSTFTCKACYNSPAVGNKWEKCQWGSTKRVYTHSKCFYKSDQEVKKPPKKVFLHPGAQMWSPEKSEPSLMAKASFATSLNSHWLVFEASEAVGELNQTNRPSILLMLCFRESPLSCADLASVSLRRIHYLTFSHSEESDLSKAQQWLRFPPSSLLFLCLQQRISGKKCWKQL